MQAPADGLVSKLLRHLNLQKLNQWLLFKRQFKNNQNLMNRKNKKWHTLIQPLKKKIL
jgi:hypothetical protein